LLREIRHSNHYKFNDINLVNIHDFFPTPTFLFTVFEMAPGGELFHVLNKSVTLSEKKTRQIMRQLFEGVAFMHSLRIVHRDLKLENVLCIDERRVVISDFGFAKQLKPGEKLRGTNRFIKLLNILLRSIWDTGLFGARNVKVGISLEYKNNFEYAYHFLF
jgi:serine/threonine protein kinase